MGLAHPCNPATWRSRSVTRRMSCLVHRLVSKSCLIITHPAAFPQSTVLAVKGRIASGKVVVIRQLQPSGILLDTLDTVGSLGTNIETFQEISSPGYLCYYFTLRTDILTHVDCSVGCTALTDKLYDNQLELW